MPTTVLDLRLGLLSPLQLVGLKMQNVNANQSTSPLILLRRRQVEKATGLSKATIYRLIVKNQFPEPVKLSERAVAWRLEEINYWISSRIKPSLIKGGM